MEFPLSFDRPIALPALPLLWAVCWLIVRSSRAPLDPVQLRQTLWVRVVVVSLICLAIAQPHWKLKSNQLSVMFVLDASDSMRPDQKAAANRFITNSLEGRGGSDRAGVVVFGKYPNLEHSPTEDYDFSGSHASVASDATDIQAALKAADAAFPDDTGRKIVLLTDGKENSGDAASEIDTLRAHGVIVDVAPAGLDLNASQSPEASIDAMHLPQAADKDTPFPIRVVMSSSVAQNGTLTVTRDGAPFGSIPVTLRAGKNVVVFSGRERLAGTHQYSAHLNVKLDTIAQNNDAFGVVTVHGQPRVLYVGEAGASGAIKTALAAQGIALDVRTPAQAPKNVSEWQQYDSVLFSDVPATEFTPDQLIGIRSSVRDFGTGFGMIGGENSYGAGLYMDTPVEDALPVLMKVPEKKRIPPAVIVIVLDASGSMSAEEGGVEKVQLAAQAAVNLMETLQPDDEVAVIAVTTDPETVVPLEPASKGRLAESQIRGLEAGGGGIYCHTGLVAAYSMIEDTTFPIKHVIMVADTTDSEEQEGCVDLARTEFLTKHITTSMLGIGDWGDDHVPFQKDVAAAGHGQMVACSRATDLPNVFQRDVQSVKAELFIEKPFRPESAPSDPVIGGVPFATEPPLLGYNLVSPKATSVVPLTAPGDADAILAYWQYGLGRSFAFTSDDQNHWAANWLGWSGYNQMWAQTIRWSLKNQISSGLETVVDRSSGRGHVVVDSFTPSGDFVDGAQLTAVVVAPDQSLVTVPLTQSAPGRYEATFDANQTGLYLLNVRDDSRPGVSQTVGFAAPYSPEFVNAPPNTALLSTLAHDTGGTYLVKPEDVFRNTHLWTIGTIALSAPFLAFAALLFLVDIAWRRLGWRVNLKALARPTEAPEAAGAYGAGSGDGLDDSFGDGSPASRRGDPNRAPVPVITMPTAKESRESTKAAYDNELLGRSASVRIGDEDDDPFPFVATRGGKR